MIFYRCINIGSLSAIATTELERNVDFWAAYLLPFLFFFLALATLIIGRKYYIKLPPGGSVIFDSVKILFLAARSKFDLETCKPSVRRAKGEAQAGEWSDLFVDEVKRALYACKVFVFYPVYWLVYGQMVNNFVSQAGTMQLHGIPNDIMQNIDPLSIIIFIPILNSFVYPFLRKIGIPFRPITRIFFGFLFAALAMAYAAIVQHLIYSAGPCYDQPLNCQAAVAPNGDVSPNNVHVAVQTPAYALIALSEIFASVTGLEYAYTKAPANMKSFIMSIFLLTNAFGAALGIALSSTAKDPKLVWMYNGIVIATGITGALFWVFFRKYNDIEEELNEIHAELRDETNAKIDHDQQIREKNEDLTKV